MATEIYLGYPPENIKNWIKEEAERKYQEMLKTPLHFTANEPNSSVLLITAVDSDSWCSFVYSTDEMKTWNDYHINTDIIQLDECENKTVYFKAKYGNTEDNPNKNGLATYTYQEEGNYYEVNNHHTFVIEGSVKASGNIQFLLDNTGLRMDVPVCCYASMFMDCSSLTQAPELPAMNLADSCYASMFHNCTSLTKAPSKLPAMNLANNCYGYMFVYCCNLTQAPSILPATTLTTECYAGMFMDCSSLTQAPELPAMNLADSCYASMFYNCTSLTKAPELPATTLTYGCYSYMFANCSSLTQAPELPATTLAKECYIGMFDGCTSLTQAPSILPATTLTTECYAGMFMDCSSLTQAPELPAMNLADSCYASMFQSCKSPFTFSNKTFDEVASLIQEQYLIGNYWHYYDEEDNEIIINPVEIICSDKTILATFDENEWTWTLTEK